MISFVMLIYFLNFVRNLPVDFAIALISDFVWASEYSPNHPFILNILLIEKICIFCLVFVRFISTFYAKVFAYVTSSAALVMKYGNEPFCDLQASSYAYKMRIW